MSTPHRENRLSSRGALKCREGAHEDAHRFCRFSLTGFAFTTSASAAPPQCSSNFCAGASNGSNCQLSGQTYTCGKYEGTPNGILYKGDLSDQTAKDKCDQHVTLNKATMKANSAATANEKVGAGGPKAAPGKPAGKPAPKTRPAAKPAPRR